jgi:Lrp/AsnC family transcriptional regulator
LLTPSRCCSQVTTNLAAFVICRFYRTGGDVDYMLRVVVSDMQSYDVFDRKLIATVTLKNVTSRFEMEKTESVTALPVPAYEAA